MTAFAGMPGAPEWAALMQRFADTLSVEGVSAEGAPLASDLLRYAVAASKATGLALPAATEPPPQGKLRDLLGPWLMAAESAYQQWARSPAAQYACSSAVSALALTADASAWDAGRHFQTFARHAGLAAEPMSRTVVHSDGAVRLFRYTDGESAKGPPLLIVYALVNRTSILDLDPDRSFIRGLVAAGRDVYLLDWGDPDPAAYPNGIRDLLDGVIDRAVKAVAGRRRIDLLGICQGGVFSLLYAATHPARIRRLVTVVTPVDFHTQDDVLSHWTRTIDTTAMANAPLVPGYLLDAMFQWLAPYRMALGKFVDLLDHAHDPLWVQRFRRMEQWVHDCPDQHAPILSEFLRHFYQANELITRTLSLGGRPIDLGDIRAPILNVYALHDHIVPPASSRALAGLTRAKRYEEVAVPTGHIGMFVSRSAAQVPGQIADWLARR